MPETRVDELAFSALRVERAGPLLEVTIDHPTSRLNAVDARLHGELTALFSALLREKRKPRFEGR